MAPSVDVRLWCIIIPDQPLELLPRIIRVVRATLPIALPSHCYKVLDLSQARSSASLQHLTHHHHSRFQPLSLSLTLSFAALFSHSEKKHSLSFGLTLLFTLLKALIRRSRRRLSGQWSQPMSAPRIQMPLWFSRRSSCLLAKRRKC